MKVKLPPKLNCKRCDYSWIPRMEDVRKCPRCKTAWWDKAKKEK